ERPRLSVYRSNKHIYAQVINDVDSRSLVLVSDLSKELAEQLKAVSEEAAGKGSAQAPTAAEPAEGEEAAGPEGSKIRRARVVGAAVAKACLDKGITKVVFDRNGYLYHGRVRALAEAAREAGLDF